MVYRLQGFIRGGRKRDISPPSPLTKISPRGRYEVCWYGGEMEEESKQSKISLCCCWGCGGGGGGGGGWW